MKFVSILGVALLLVLCGCATQSGVARKQGEGTTQIYAAQYLPTWRAAIDAAQQDGLEVMTADRASGYISARRTARAHTLGENVGLWVREISPGRTQVEVVSRQAGPPVAWFKNWENEIHRAIAANLTRDGTAVGAAPRQVIIDQGTSSTVVVPERRETVIVPETPTHESITEQQRIVEQLRLREDTGRRALVNEVDETKREILQREVDRLREDIRLQEQRLRDLEKQLR